ncbi:MAG: Hsp70 family protein [Clostridiales bacterium]|nr:Hsp70 family protein [Clostridiales bacterium]
MNWEDYKRQIERDGKLAEDYYILGIDLGTTNSVISFWDSVSGKPVPIDISNGFGKAPMPSVVQYRADEEGASGEWVVGEEAYRSLKIYPDATARSVKRKMGTAEAFPLAGREYAPEELSARILRALIDHCENLNPKAEIAGVVVSVPYDFDDAAKKATMRACELAGLKDALICLVEEPKAAALAYNFKNKLNFGEKIMVFDFGGGTLDITVFNVAQRPDGGVKLQVISEGGEAFHGGDNVDETVIARCYEFIAGKTGQGREALSRENQVELELKAREAKERLSGVKNFRIPFTFCIPPFVEQLSREDFEALISPFIEKTRKLAQKTLREAYTGPLSPESVTRILLEGGSCQMPWVREMLMDIARDADKIYASDTPALDISLGATYYAAMKMGLLSQPDMETEKLSPPIEFETTVPHDIGFEVCHGNKRSFFTMIKRGTTYALATKSKIFPIYGETEEDMTSFGLKILERINKDDSIGDCRLIGEVEITGLPPRPSGKTRLNITISAAEEGGIVYGSVADMGCGADFPATDYKKDFNPSRFEKVRLEKG